MGYRKSREQFARHVTLAIETMPIYDSECLIVTYSDYSEKWFQHRNTWKFSIEYICINHINKSCIFDKYTLSYST